MLQTREFELRANTATEDRTVTGIAVPFNDPVDVGGYKEMIAPNAIMPRDNIKLFYGHEEPIGRIVESKDTEAGWSITAKISETSRGNEVYTLLKDGVLDRFSIGFMPMEENEDENGTIVRTKIDVREVSIVPIPAYEGAKVEEVRNSQEVAQELAPAINKEIDVDNVAIEEMRESVEALERKVSTLSVVEAAPKLDTRSAGDIVKALASGDEATKREYELVTRAYTGGTSADAIVKPAWVGDLTKIVKEGQPLSALFAGGNLPSKGMSIEFAQLKSNTMTVTEVAEGDDLPFGKVQVETKTAPVKLYGGYTQLTRTEIERSETNILNVAIEAQAVEASMRIGAVLRSFYGTVHAAQVTADNVVEIPSTGVSYKDWLKATLRAAAKFSTLGRSLDALVVGMDAYEAFLDFEDSEGRPVVGINGSGVNTVGSLNITGLSGKFIDVPIVLDPALVAGKEAFVNASAIRLYTSPVVSLQDENILNLTKDFSVHTYAAVADEIPAGIVPVVEAA